MPLYDYVCPAGHVTESLQGREVTTISCSCGAPAQRQSVYRFAVTGDLPTQGGQQPKYPVSRLKEATEEATYYHERMENDRGRPIPRRPLLNIAAKQARRRGAKVRPFPKGA